jgi:hypothetical protein
MILSFAHIIYRVKLKKIAVKKREPLGFTAIFKLLDTK